MFFWGHGVVFSDVKTLWKLKAYHQRDNFLPGTPLWHVLYTFAAIKLQQID